eukprot:SAG11_NODE_30508_length_300_cov_0.835821_1_plen_22_part_01
MSHVQLYTNTYMSEMLVYANDG